MLRRFSKVREWHIFYHRELYLRAAAARAVAYSFFWCQHSCHEAYEQPMLVLLVEQYCSASTHEEKSV